MDTLLQLREKYSNVRKFLEEEYKKDPETEPYRSKYKAKSILSDMKEIITNKIESLDSEDSQVTSYTAMLAVVLYQIGLICVDTEEPPEGEKFFKACFESIPNHLNPDFVLVSIHVRNQLGILCSQRSEPKDAQIWLEGAEKVYTDFKDQSLEIIPKHFHDHFEDSGSPTGEKEMELVHILTKFYLAQVYGVLKDVIKSAIYCHETLRSQLVYNEYDPIDWALNSATLSQFFMKRYLFKQARHHLAAASYILDNYEDSIRELKGSSEEVEAKKEELRHRSADVSRCWAKYGIFLLEYSENCLNDQNNAISKDKIEDLEKLWFESLDLTIYENQITDIEVILFEDARELFLITQKHLNKAKEYYSLEDRASDHADIVQDHNQLFRHLIAFEQDEDRQCKMMKKRIDMLEVVLKELNPKYYMDRCRQFWFELGKIYYDIMNIKLQKIKDSTNTPTPQALRKVNTLAESSIMNFNNFLDSVKDKTTKKLPETLSEDLVGPTLNAHFSLGWLFYKYITQDKSKQIENTTKSYEYFKYVVEYCEKNENAISTITEELNISKDMMTLLQMRILQF